MLQNCLLWYSAVAVPVETCPNLPSRALQRANPEGKHEMPCPSWVVVPFRPFISKGKPSCFDRRSFALERGTLVTAHASQDSLR